MPRYLSALTLSLVLGGVLSLSAQAAPAPKEASSLNLGERGKFPTEVVAPIARGSMATIEAIGLPYSGASTASPYQKTVRKIGGSGFVMTSDGLIVTSSATVTDSKYVNVTIEREKYDAKILYTDEFYEIAVLKIDDPKAKGVRFKPVKWGNSNLMPVGSPVVVMGSPATLDLTMTYGFVTNIRDIRLRGAGGLSTGVLVPDGLEIDAAIVPSNYGGPVFNELGEVVGLVNRYTGRESGQQNLNYSVPSNVIKPIIDELISKGRAFHPWLGVEPYIGYSGSKNLAVYLGVPTRAINPDTNESYGIVGVLVGSISVGSPAAEAGLIRGDLLLKFNGTLMKDTKALELRVLALKQGESFVLTIVRNGAVVNKRITIADRPTVKEQQDQGIRPQFYGI